MHDCILSKAEDWNRTSAELEELFSSHLTWDLVDPLLVKMVKVRHSSDCWLRDAQWRMLHYMLIWSRRLALTCRQPGGEGHVADMT